MKELLKLIEKNARYEVKDLADLLGVTRQTIISLEGGRYNPSITLAFKLARAFELHIEDIFIYEEGDGS